MSTRKLGKMGLGVPPKFTRANYRFIVNSQLKQDSIFNLLGLELNFMTFLPRQNKGNFPLKIRINLCFGIIHIFFLKFKYCFLTSEGYFFWKRQRQLNSGISTNLLMGLGFTQPHWFTKMFHFTHPFEFIQNAHNVTARPEILNFLKLQKDYFL